MVFIVRWTFLYIFLSITSASDNFSLIGSSIHSWTGLTSQNIWYRRDHIPSLYCNYAYDICNLRCVNTKIDVWTEIYQRCHFFYCDILTKCVFAYYGWRLLLEELMWFLQILIMNCILKNKMLQKKSPRKI